MDFMKLNSLEEAQERKGKEFRDYFKEYLEAPPLNGVIPGRGNWISELKGGQTVSGMTSA